MKNTVVCLVILLYCLTTSVLYAQETWKNYTVEDGLPNNEIRAIAEDANGVKWFGTDGGGVARLDGESWTVYDEDDGLVYNNARELAVDRSGVLWVGTPRGVSSYDGVKWTTYTTENSGLASDYVISLAVDEDNVKWFGTYGKGVSRFDGEKWITYTTEDGLVNDKVNAIAFDINGTVWFGTYGGVSKYMNGVWKTYTVDTCGMSSNIVYAIAADSDNEIWFGTRKGVSSFDGESWKVYTARTKYNILDDRSILSIDIDENGVKWFGASVGMWSYDGNTWESFTRRESNLEKDVYVRALHMDTDGKAWIGTRNALTAYKAETKPIQKKTVMPAQMTIAGSYPNPFNPSTTIEYVIPENGHVSIDVYNITGQKIRTILSETMASGQYSVVWNGTNDAGLSVASGVYLFRLEMGTTSLSHRMLLMR